MITAEEINQGNRTTKDCKQHDQKQLEEKRVYFNLR